MKLLQIVEGHIHAPYFIFIDGATKYSDNEVMAMLGIEGFAEDRKPRFPKHVVHLTDDGRWLHVVDDWYYTLWQSETTRDHLAEIELDLLETAALVEVRVECLACGQSEQGLSPRLPAKR